MFGILICVLLNSPAWQSSDAKQHRPDFGSNAIAKEFLGEYPSASRKVEHAYLRSRIVARTIKYSPKDRKAFAQVVRGSSPGEKLDVPVETSILKWEYRGNGSAYRVVSTTDDQPVYVIVTTPKRTFRLRAVEGKSGYRVDASGQTAPGADGRMRSPILRTFEAVTAPYMVYLRKIADDVEQGEIQIKGAREEIDATSGMRIVRVDWESHADKAAHRRVGYYRFLPSACWVLIEYENLAQEVQFPGEKSGPVGDHGILRYEASSVRGDVPKLVGLDVWRVNPQRSEVRLRSVQVSGIQWGEAPEDDFTLAAFGLKEAPESSPHRVWRYLLAFSLVAALAALGIKTLANQLVRLDRLPVGAQ